MERYRVFLLVKGKLDIFAANIAIFVNDLTAYGKFHVEDMKLLFACIPCRIGKSVCIQLFCGGSHLWAAVVLQTFEPVPLLRRQLPRQIPQLGEYHFL